MSNRGNKQPLRRYLTLLASVVFLLSACGVIRTTYRLTKGTVVMAYKVTKFAGSTVYTVGGFTFDVINKLPHKKGGIFIFVLDTLNLSRFKYLSPLPAGTKLYGMF